MKAFAWNVLTFSGTAFISEFQESNIPGMNVIIVLLFLCIEFQRDEGWKDKDPFLSCSALIQEVLPDKKIKISF